MSATNPYLFSSMGMLILSVIISNIAMAETTRVNRRGRPTGLLEGAPA
jgi:hypothetical protein